MYVRRNGLFFVGATKFNVAPALVLELLIRLEALCLLMVLWGRGML